MNSTMTAEHTQENVQLHLKIFCNCFVSGLFLGLNAYLWCMCGGLEFRIKYIKNGTCQCCFEKVRGFFSKKERKSTKNCCAISSDVSALEKEVKISQQETHFKIKWWHCPEKKTYIEWSFTEFSLRKKQWQAYLQLNLIKKLWKPFSNCPFFGFKNFQKSSCMLIKCCEKILLEVFACYANKLCIDL